MRYCHDEVSRWRLKLYEMEVREHGRYGIRFTPSTVGCLRIVMGYKNWLGGCKLGGFGLVIYYHLPWIHVFAGKEAGASFSACYSSMLQGQCRLVSSQEVGISHEIAKVPDFVSSLPVDQAIGYFAGCRTTTTPYCGA